MVGRGELGGLQWVGCGRAQGRVCLSKKEGIRPEKIKGDLDVAGWGEVRRGTLRRGGGGR